MKTTIAAAVAALAAGTWLGYEFAPRGAAPAADENVGERHPAVIADVGESASIAALRARVKDLEGALAKAKSSAAAVDVDAVAAELGIPVEKGEDGKYRVRPPTREEMRANREKWRAEHPEEAARFDAELRKMRERRVARAQSRLDFLASVDTSAMSAEDRATHEEMQSLIARREELRAKLHEEGVSDDERDKLHGELFATERALREKGGEERKVLFRQTAAALGFTGEDAEEIVAALGEITEATEQGGHGHGHMPGMFGGPGMGGEGRARGARR